MTRKRKWFWAARNSRSGNIWNMRAVSLFGPSRKPDHIYGNEWKDDQGCVGGQLCYGVFNRLTGVVLKPGQVKKVYMPLGAFQSVRTNITP